MRRMYKRLAVFKARGWLLLGTLLGVGTLPCPECGAPMIIHFWPITGVILVVELLKRRYRGASPAESEKGGGQCHTC